MHGVYVVDKAFVYLTWLNSSFLNISKILWIYGGPYLSWGNKPVKWLSDSPYYIPNLKYQSAHIPFYWKDFTTFGYFTSWNYGDNT